MKKYFRPLVIASIVLIYLIIIAGAVVRMTGSGMGCPDWPKCFGYYIPPTEEAQIQWKPNHEYQKGFIVILNKELRIATNDFTSSTAYNSSNWEPYTKHDYAKFNVWHTWIEYINRLTTVLSGIPILLMFIISLWFWKEKRKLPLLAGLTIIAMGFQAWLGKIVVDSNLLPLRITVHMLVAFIILAILLYILFLTRERITSVRFNTTFKNVLLFSAIFTLIQVAIGTQVRQHIDEQLKIVADLAKSQWLDPPTLTFYIHRSFSILIVVINVWLLWYNKKMQLGLSKLNWVIGLIALEALTGILMYYFDFPFLSQPLHLVLSSLLFGVQFYIILEVFKNKVIEA
ncbi:COX15/CtaA family protein [Aquimarina sp. 2201CG14-23]|uniref:COX15/CtaA family protein n=1 Tax=Aquimarina mycalae TaxID=3040073 RepID=UPI002477F0D4|nr:COX15/CtaA family protein [Aquimarina sp. 2201CG14-23]MDH7447000.1 COX15/CtaA family protein [Aquimarina sp. 2201CG14-23]